MIENELAEFGGISFVGDRIAKKVKNCLLFFNFVKKIYTPHAYITQKTPAKKKKQLVKYNTQINRENMQELMTYLVHYLTGSRRNAEYIADQSL